VPDGVEEAQQLFLRSGDNLGQPFTELQADGAYGLWQDERIKLAGAAASNAHERD
jgi:hypothetical protein